MKKEEKKYYYKATKKDGVSDYDPNFKYHLGLNIHPNPDRKSKEACGRGMHLAVSIHEAMGHVSNWEEIYLCTTDDIIGGDESKIRVGRCDALCLIPNSIIAEYNTKWDALDAEYNTKRDALDAEYKPKREALDAEYKPKREALYAEYKPKREALDAEYNTKWDALYAEYKPKWDALDAEYKPKWDALDKKTLKKILRHYKKAKE